MLQSEDFAARYIVKPQLKVEQSELPTIHNNFSLSNFTLEKVALLLMRPDSLVEEIMETLVQLVPPTKKARSVN